MFTLNNNLLKNKTLTIPYENHRILIKLKEAGNFIILNPFIYPTPKSVCKLNISQYLNHNQSHPFDNFI